VRRLAAALRAANRSRSKSRTELAALQIGCLFPQLHFDGFAQGVYRFQVEPGFDGYFLAGQILGHSP
jgi:hypothetical protein